MSFAVIWDMDGTLVDTAELHFRAWGKLACEIGRTFTRADFVATFGMRNPEIFRQLWGNHWTEAQIADMGDRKEILYRSEAENGVDLLPGVRKLLEDLHAAGFKQAIGSSAPRKNLDLITRLTRTEPLFGTVVSMEDTERGKPDPQVFLVAAQRLGAEPARCLVVEDAVAGVEAAKAGGMKCIAVRFVGHHSEDKLKAAGADLIVPSLVQVDVQTVKQLLQ
ncbi:MAG: HAD family phosphatase [Gemmataceae bacterium]|nr:HAD family phosphatase [Gemmataceae bacterium]